MAHRGWVQAPSGALSQPPRSPPSTHEPSCEVGYPLLHTTYLRTPSPRRRRFRDNLARSRPLVLLLAPVSSSSLPRGIGTEMLSHTGCAEALPEEVVLKSSALG